MASAREAGLWLGSSGGDAMGEAQVDGGDVARSAVAKMSWRILPLLFLGYLVAFIDRVNIGFAAVRMNQDLHFSATVYGVGGGLFFLSYALFEVPSNLFTARVGARRWIARIMVSWGVVAVLMTFVRTPLQFYVLRFLLGFAEAGFFPAAIFYLVHWFPKAHRGVAVSRFYAAGPATSVVMGVLSGALMGLEGRVGLHGWQWLFLVEGSPAILVGLLIWRFLPDAPASAAWLTADEKAWLAAAQATDAARLGEPDRHDALAALRHPLVLQLGVIGFLTIGCYYALTLSGPALLMSHAGLDVTQAGYVVSAGGVLGAAAMLATGWLSDRVGDRFGVLIASLLLVALAYQVLALASAPGWTVAAFLLFHLAWTTVTTATVLLWGDVLPIPLLAVGCAAANSINQVGGFLGPVLWGLSKDATGSFRPALTGLAVATLAAVALTLVLRRQVRRPSPTLAAAAPA